MDLHHRKVDAGRQTYQVHLLPCDIPNLLVRVGCQARDTIDDVMNGGIAAGRAFDANDDNDDDDENDDENKGDDGRQ